MQLSLKYKKKCLRASFFFLVCYLLFIMLGGPGRTDYSTGRASHTGKLLLLILLLLTIIIVIIIRRFYSSLRALAYPPTADLIPTSPHTEMKDHPASLRVTCVQHIESPTFTGFLDQEYCNKSKATQIPHNVEAQIPYAG